MFIARRPQKWRIASRTTAGHAGFTQRSATSPGSRTAGSPQTGQRLGMTYGGALRGPLLEHHAHDLGDDVAPLLDDDGVPDADVLSRQVLVVVERGALDRRSGELDRVEVRDRRERPRAADVHADLAHDGRGLLGRELVGERPARRLGGRAELALRRPVVDLDDHAVGLESELVALVLPLLDELPHLREGLAAAPVRVHREARARRDARAPRSGWPARARPRRPNRARRRAASAP